jgi:hypothetical protein
MSERKHHVYSVHARAQPSTVDEVIVAPNLAKKGAAFGLAAGYIPLKPSHNGLEIFPEHRTEPR